MEEWIKNLWHIYTLEYYSVVKNNGILNLALDFKCGGMASFNTVDDNEKEMEMIDHY